MKTLEEISHDSFYKMDKYNQITVDFVQSAEQLFDDSPDNKAEQKEFITELNVLSYGIGLALEVFNPQLENQISDLTDLLSLIEIRIGYIESLDFKF